MKFPSVFAAPPNNSADRHRLNKHLEKRIYELEQAELEVLLDDMELKKSEERFKLLSEASFEAIFLSEEGICLDQNRAAEKMSGYTRAEAIGRHGTEWIAPEDREQVNNIINSRPEHENPKKDAQ